MNCVVTQMPTDSKWRNLPLSIDARRYAQELHASEPKKYPNMIDAINAAREEFLKLITEELGALGDVKITQDNINGI